MVQKQSKVNNGSIKLSVAPALGAKIEEISESHGISVTAVVRAALLFYYDEHFLFNKGRVKRLHPSMPIAKQPAKISKSESQQSHADQIRAMSAEELTAHLKEIGYFPPTEKIGSRFSEHIIIQNELGDKIYVQRQIEESTGEVVYQRDTFNLDEIITQLKKQKKL